MPIIVWISAICAREIMSSFQDLYNSKKKSTQEFISLIQGKDRLATSIAAGQPRTLLNALSDKTDIENLEIFTGLCAFPYPLFTHEKVKVISGYYGPIERMLNDMGANVAYLPLAFNAFEIFAKSFKPRVVMTTLSAMDEKGRLSFGSNAEAIYCPFIEASKDKSRLTVGEINPQMPVVYGLRELGNNQISIEDLDVVVESDQSLLELPPAEMNAAEKKIAELVVSLLKSGDTLQFGIGAIPNEVARLLSESSLTNFGIHSELISDGFVTLMESGKISNTQKGLHEGKSLFAFALGSQKLYEWLDERKGHNHGRALAAPVSYVNDPHIIAKNQNMASVNSGFMIDLSGQVSSEAIGEKQYSGVGGQLNFVQGAFHSPDGRSILCIKSSVEIEGKRYSNIVEALPPGSIISTPRHYAQYIVTEQGIANLYGLTDEERCYELVKIAHPDFKEELLKQARERDKNYYHSKRLS
ncbi:MAG: hypothetical protein HQM15_10670 [Deltaproteobacteria bacterium]|nr:hypothetical protein [Deltaproteobacteria bacterium]